MLRNWPGNRNLNLKELMLKLAILFLLVLGQTIVSHSLKGMVEGEKEVTFNLSKLLN